MRSLGGLSINRAVARYGKGTVMVALGAKMAVRGGTWGGTGVLCHCTVRRCTPSLLPFPCLMGFGRRVRKMIEEPVLRSDKKIGNSIAIKIAGARAGGVSGQLFVGEISLPHEAPAAVCRTHLPPEDDILRVHDEVGLAVAIPIGKTELTASA